MRQERESTLRSTALECVNTKQQLRLRGRSWLLLCVLLAHAIEVQTHGNEVQTHGNEVPAHQPLNTQHLGYASPLCFLLLLSSLHFTMLMIAKEVVLQCIRCC